MLTASTLESGSQASHETDLLVTLLIAVIVSVIAPLLLGYMQNRAHQKERKEDWEHNQQITNSMTEKAQERHTETMDQLRTNQFSKFHTAALLNARRSELSALEEAYSALQKIIEMDREHDAPIDPSDLNALEIKRNRISKLRMIIIAEEYAMEEEANVQKS